MASSEGTRDAAALASCPPPDAFMVPKVRTGSDVREAAGRLPGAAVLLPLIETARGLENAVAIAACDGVAGLVFGGFDLAIELGAEPCWEALLYARSRVVHAAALGGLDAIDMPSRDFGEMSGLRQEAARARRLGFAGKAAIHPAQIPVIHEVFTPSPDEVRRAHEIVEADRAAGGSAVALKGRMVDRPVVEAARRVLRRARPGSTP
jgi:citrate lyase beta subunit